MWHWFANIMPSVLSPYELQSQEGIVHCKSPVFFKPSRWCISNVTDSSKILYCKICILSHSGSNSFWFVYYILQFPIQLLLKVIVPRVDYDKDKHGWNKFLNVSQVITGPMFCLAVFKGKPRIYPVKTICWLTKKEWVPFIGPIRYIVKTMVTHKNVKWNVD